MEKLSALLAGLDVQTSHIYREANVSADILSNVALEFDDFHWWNYVFPAIRIAVTKDMTWLPKYRFC